MTEETISATELNSMNETNYSLRGEKLLMDVEPGEEIVISGMSGVFPNSNNVHEYRDNLFNKVNMVLPNRRFKVDHPEIPPRSGTIPNVDRYDTGFFGVHLRQSNSIDPQMSVLQEKAVEAIFDAGLHPSDLENTRTGVFTGISVSENAGEWFFWNLLPNTYAITGSQLSMSAHRLSYFLKLKGPSCMVDSACSTSLYELENAYRSLITGEIDNAIVAASQLCLYPFVTLQFSRLGVLNKDGICKPFDADGKGYARAEAVTVLFLQKAKNAKRIYSKVVHVKTSCDGFKEQGIASPSRENQIRLFNEFYDICKIDRYSLSFLEAHGTGTLAGDLEESYSIDTVFTKERTTPLLIGSVRSNMGHSEPASGLCSIIKCIIGMETGFIPPNIHYEKPRAELKGLIEGRLKVVTEKMPFQDNLGLIGINSFGYGGAISHLLMQRNVKTKKNVSVSDSNIPRLACVSGRTDTAVISLLDSIVNSNFDDEYIKLLHNAFRKNVENHQYRGFTIVSHSEQIMRSTNTLNHFPSNCKPLHIIFGILKNWRKIGSELMLLPMFSTYIERIQRIIIEKVNIEDLFRNKSPNEDVGYIFGNVVVQMGLIHILCELEIAPTSNMGFSTGELSSAYFDGLLSLEETVNYAFSIDESLFKISKTLESSENTKISEVIEKNYTVVEGVTTDNLVSSISNIVSNEESNVERMNNFRFTEICNNFEWLKNDLIEEVSQTLVHKGYKNLKVKQFINAIFNKVSPKIDVNQQCVILNIDDNKLEMSEHYCYIPIFSEGANYLIDLLNSIGRLYEYGYNSQISKLYNSVQWPVARGTEMISPYIKWNHNRLKYIPVHKPQSTTQDHSGRTIIIQKEDRLWNFLKGHVTDGMNLFPAMGFIYLVWETFSNIMNTPIIVTKVCFKNCKFVRAVIIPSQEHLALSINIQSGSGNFEVTHENSIVATGNISLLDNKENNDVVFPHKIDDNLENNDVNLTSKDFYKELRLRGYDYKAEFQAVEKCNSTATSAFIKWEENWVTFMDNMSQIRILQYDTRLLYVPTFISKLTILATDHIAFVNSKLTEGVTPVLPVKSDKITGKLSSGGITFWGLNGAPISRKKLLDVPVLKSYMFIPNFTVLDIHQSVVVNIQIIVENAGTYKIKAVELIDHFTNKKTLPLMPIVKSVLEDEPLVQPFLKILTKIPIENLLVETKDEELNSETDCLLVIASKILDRPDVMKAACASLVENGFIISRESHNYNVPKEVSGDLKIFTLHQTTDESIVLLQKQTKIKKIKYIKINSEKSYAWLPKVQNAVTNEKNVILYAENEPNNGILGLINCLRKEPLTKNVGCVFIMDKAEEFSPHIPLYSNQLDKGMSVNVYKYRQWGTYRHLPLKEKKVESEYCLMNMVSRGDLSSLRWSEGPLRHNMKQEPDKEFIYVYYSSLNFRDIMTATRRISVDATPMNRLEQECIEGLEFAGRNSNGDRVMGMKSHGAFSTLLLLSDIQVLFKVPDDWSLEEAATVPLVYSTVIYSLILRGQMVRGETILIHSGTGGIGQAAIRMALHYRCKVFTTVGTKEKRDALKKTFPCLKDHHIGNSRDESFEQLVLRGTNGRGVDLVLNSLAEEKLQTSIRCLAKGGRFIEIGKFDIAKNNEVKTLLFQKEASFHGVMLDHLFAETSTTKQKLVKAVEEGIKNGVIKPLPSSVFKYNEIEQAFRFMTNGKHMGKVLVQLRELEKEFCVSQLRKSFVATPRYYCDSEKVYIIVGGLGGFGLELVDWLILRGAKKLMLVSRKGVTTGYQSYRLRVWKTYGVTVKISTSPITTREGCKYVIKESLLLGPIDAIFNLAVVLADAIFENQTPEKFSTCFGPKAYAAEYLDDITRELCPNLREFVMFSSSSCGIGIGGQTNYAMSNSAMERICENRKNAGYPALAIEWGAIGEVGRIAEMFDNNTAVEIGGTRQQTISSCLQTLDILLRQKEAAIVSSIVVAEKLSSHNKDSVVEAVMNIIGIKDPKYISFHSTLAELGMESMTSLETKELLERHFGIFLSPKDIRKTTLAKLGDIQNQSVCKGGAENKLVNLDIKMVANLNKNTIYNFEAYEELASKASENSPTVLLFPGIEGFAYIYQQFTKNLYAYVVGVQFALENKPKTIVEIAMNTLPTVKKFFPNNEFIFVAYSYGTLIALEVVSILESCGYKGTLICIDGTPSAVKEMFINMGIEIENIFETGLICHIISLYISLEESEKHKESFYKCTTWNERVDLAITLLEDKVTYDIDHLKLLVNSIYNRAKAVLNYTPKYSKLKTNIVLFKPTQESVLGLPEDYGLSEYFEKPVQIHTIEGNHFTIIKNTKLQEMVNSYIQGFVRI